MSPVNFFCGLRVPILRMALRSSYFFYSFNTLYEISASWASWVLLLLRSMIFFIAVFDFLLFRLLVYSLWSILFFIFLYKIFAALSCLFSFSWSYKSYESKLPDLEVNSDCKSEGNVLSRESILSILSIISFYNLNLSFSSSLALREPLISLMSGTHVSGSSLTSWMNLCLLMFSKFDFI